MTGSCGGICMRPECAAPHPNRQNGGWIGLTRVYPHFARCRTCEAYVNMKGLWCMCCGLRLTRRNTSKAGRASRQVKRIEP